MKSADRFGMYTPEGDALVDRIVKAGIKLGQERAASNADIWGFVYRELDKLSCAEGFEEATDTVVREAAYGTLFDQLPGFTLTEDEYWFFA